MLEFGLSKETIEKIQTVFSKYTEVEKVIIYGSRAKGNFRTGSDIDLTMYGNTITNETISKILIDIDDLNTPYLFDISNFHQLDSQDIIEHINRVGKLFYAKD